MKEPLKKCRWCGRELKAKDVRFSGLRSVRKGGEVVKTPLFECKDMRRCMMPDERGKVVEQI
jgi:hypothetical protein